MSLLLCGCGKGVDGGAAGSAPVANFTGTPTTGTDPQVVAFTDSSTGSPTSWLWQFNLNSAGWVNFNGTPTAQNPSESFASGFYDIRLTATNAFGSNTKTRLSYLNIQAGG